MPFYIRKSVSVGPFRFNLSKGGIGVSAGVTGFRIGTGPRGHYVHAGRGGLYYRASLGGGSEGPGHRPSGARLQPSQQAPIASNPDAEMIRVSSADVIEMKDARFIELLEELNAKQLQTKLSTVLGGIAAVIGLGLMLKLGLKGFAAGIALTLIGVWVGTYLDGYRRAVVVMYDLEDDAEAAYKDLTTAFDAMTKAAGIWRIDSGGEIRDLAAWKRNAGASHIIDRKPTTFGYALPPILKSNITPPSMQVGKETLFFLPDVIIVLEGNKFGAVAYDRLTVRWQERRYIEDESVPSDAKVVGQTWMHPNKDGGPDRRFANNRQVPICLYETIHLSSTNGLNELIQLSILGRAAPFAEAAKKLAGSIGSSQALALPQL